MPTTHVALFNATTGYIYGIWDVATHGALSNSGTWTTDGYLNFATTGKQAQGFEDKDLLGTVDTSAMDIVELDTPTLDNSDWEKGGVLQVNDTTTPTDTEERTDGDRYEGDDYTYSV